MCVCYKLSPSQRAVPCKVEPQPGKAGISLVRYTPTEEGVHAVNVSYDGHPVPGSPFPVEAQLPPDPSKVTSASDPRVCQYLILENTFYVLGSFKK